MEADLRVLGMGVRRAMRQLERQEPDLAEYLMETLTRLYGRLEGACGSRRSAGSVHRQAVLLVLICTEAVRRSA